MDKETEVGCFAVVVALVLVVAVWFLMPYVCMIAWTAVATAWSLPLFTYWQWFFISLAIRWLFKPSVSMDKPEIKVKS